MDAISHQLHVNEAVTKSGGAFYNNLEGYSEFKLQYYQCHQCKNPYFGGLYDCPQHFNTELNEETKEGYKPPQPEDIKCKTCRLDAKVASQQKCSIHGWEYLEYKCKFCCKQAKYLCPNDIHYCEPCHYNHAKV